MFGDSFVYHNVHNAADIWCIEATHTAETLNTQHSPFSHKKNYPFQNTDSADGRKPGIEWAGLHAHT